MLFSGVGLAGFLTLVMIVGFVEFTANVIQFGMDQLHDSPGEDQSLVHVALLHQCVPLTTGMESHSNLL